MAGLLARAYDLAEEGIITNVGSFDDGSYDEDEDDFYFEDDEDDDYFEDEDFFDDDDDDYFEEDD